MKSFRILVINPGSTSTKIALFEDEKEIFGISISHSSGELAPFARVSDQHGFRKQVIEQVLRENDIDIQTLDGVVGRGGLIRSIPSGTYAVNDRMIADLEEAARGEHASNLGGLIARDIADNVGVRAFIVDPVVVDEMADVARFSGLPELERLSIFHALNQKAVARKAADELGKSYKAVNLIVVHMGGGISVGAHDHGRVVDVNNAFNGDGPFTPERAGGVPAAQLVDLCYSGQYEKDALKKRLVGKGGMVAYLGTNDMRKVENDVKAGDKRSTLLHTAMAYQVCKEIGCFASALKGKVDAIVLTGGLAYNKIFVDLIREYTGWIATILVYPGEEEMTALALGGLRVLRGDEDAKAYE